MKSRNIMGCSSCDSSKIAMPSNSYFLVHIIHNFTITQKQSMVDPHWVLAKTSKVKERFAKKQNKV